MVAAHDGPGLGAHQVDHFAAEGHGVDQVAVDDDLVGLQPLQFRHDGLEGGHVAVNIGKEGDPHGPSHDKAQARLQSAQGTRSDAKGISHPA